MKAKSKAERRAYPRFLTQVKAQCFHVLSDGTAEKTAAKVSGMWSKEGKLLTGNPHSKGVVRDISFSGLYLEALRPFREGTILVIELQLPRRKTKVVVIGLVRWVKGNGLGVQFIYMQKADWETLQKLLKEAKE